MSTTGTRHYLFTLDDGARLRVTSGTLDVRRGPGSLRQVRLHDPNCVTGVFHSVASVEDAQLGVFHPCESCGEFAPRLEMLNLRGHPLDMDACETLWCAGCAYERCVLCGTPTVALNARRCDHHDGTVCSKHEILFFDRCGIPLADGDMYDYSFCRACVDAGSVSEHWASVGRAGG